MLIPEPFFCLTNAAKQLARCGAQCRECAEGCPPDPALPLLSLAECAALAGTMDADGWMAHAGRATVLQVRQLARSLKVHAGADR